MSAGYIYSESDTAVTGSSQPAQTSRRQIFISNSLWFIAAGQIERVVGILLSFSLRWGLSLADIGVYSGLRLLLDNTSYSSLGVALGAIQKRPVLFASGNPAEAERLTNVAAGTNSITSGIYASALIIWGLYLTLFGKIQWGIGLICVGLMVVLKRRQDFQIAIMRSDGRFFSTSRIAIQVNFAFSIFIIAGILLIGFWGMLLGLFFGFVWQGILLAKADDSVFLQDTFDFRTACHLALTGLPILAMNSSWMLMGSLDRVLILGVMPDGETQAGYYSIAILATSWCQDVAGRISLVLYPEYQKNVGKGIDRGIILKQAEYGTMMLLGALMAVSLWIMPFCYYIIPQIFPRLSPGLAAFLTMLPGSIFFAAAWPIRQALIATGNSWAGTVVALIILIPQFLVLKSVCATRSISEVAMISSLFQMLATMLLILIVWNKTKWDYNSFIFRMKMSIVIPLGLFGYLKIRDFLSSDIVMNLDNHLFYRLLCVILPVTILISSFLFAIFRSQRNLLSVNGV